MAALEAKDGRDLNIVVRDLAFSYTPGKRVFEGLSFDASEGRVLSILGPNGAGKSTLLGCIAGLLTPDAGDVSLDGRSYRSLPQNEMAKAVGFVPQSIAVSFDYSVVDYVVTGCAPRMGVFQRPKSSEYDVAWQAIRNMGLEHIADKSVMRISAGERQQAAIARVLAQRPRFIILDEPTAHLDLGNLVKVLETLQRLAGEGYGVIMSTHNPDHSLLLGDEVAVMDRKGNFTHGATCDVLSEAFLSSLYGTDLRLVDVDTLGRKVCVIRGIGAGGD